MEECIQFCRVCLKTDVRMHDMNKVSIFEDYQRILGVSIENMVMTPLYACYECASLLYKYKKFRSKCELSHSLLSTLQNDLFTVTAKQIKDIHQLGNTDSLQSCIKIKHLDTIDVKYEDEIDKDSILQLENICKQELGQYLDLDNDFNEDSDHEPQCDDEILNELISPSTIKTKEKHKKTKKTIKTKQKKTKNKKHPTEEKTKQDITIKLETAESDSFEDFKVFLTNDADYESENDNKPLIKFAKRTGNKIYSKTLRDELEREAIVEVLTYEQAMQYVEERKESINYTICPLKCDLCYRGFETQRTFENHIKKHSVECGPNICEFCKLRFKEKRHLDKHNLTCHKFKIVCKTCHYTCSGMQQARIHLNSHKGEMYACKDCDEKFRYPNSLLNHRHTKHPTQCVCEFCGNIFGTPRGLLTHKSLMHKGEISDPSAGPRCESCDVTFVTEEAWKRHLVLSSRHNVDNGCEQCGETFSNREELKKHVTTAHSRPTLQRKYLYVYTEKFPTKCKICTVQLKDKMEFKAHYKNLHPDARFTKRIYSHERKHVCEVCGKVFKHRFSLRYHQTKHSGEKPYHCKLCSARFSTPAALYQHKHKHTRTNKDNQCDVCHKVLGGPSQLRKHKRIHLPVRPHQCSLCDKTFLNRCEVVQHVKHFHYKVPWPKRDRRKRDIVENK